MTKIQRIYKLCPSLAFMSFDQSMTAIVRMCIAHQLNGGEFRGLYDTALEYLETLKKS